MKKSFGTKPLVYPQPVFIIATYNCDGTVDAMNAAWAHVCDYTKVSIIIDKSHKTTANILERKSFTVSIADLPRMTESDYLGIVSANDVPDKFSKTGFTTTKSEFVDAPVINEYPLTLECRLVSWDEATERVVGEVVNCLVDDSILTDDKIDLKKFRPLTYDGANHNYVVLGDVVGNAFNEGKKLK